MIWRILLLIVGFRLALMIAEEEGKKREARMFLAMTGHQLEEEPQKPSLLKSYYKEHKPFIRIVCCVLFFVIGIIFVGTGIVKMNEQTKIENEGKKINAKVVQCEAKKVYLELRRIEYHYLVEFVVDGKVIQGKTISSHSTLVGKDIDIYYLPDTLDEVCNVVIAGADYRVGISEQLYGVMGLIIAAGFFWAMRSRGES